MLGAPWLRIRIKASDPTEPGPQIPVPGSGIFPTVTLGFSRPRPGQNESARITETEVAILRVGSPDRRVDSRSRVRVVGRIDDRLAALGLALPPVLPPAGNYVGCVLESGLLHVGGHGPVAGSEVITGKVGDTVDLDTGVEAARMTALSILATMRAELGDLDRVRRIVKVFGMVNVAPGFNRTPQVIDGCSDLLVDVFGDAGRHTRSAVGLAELPFDIAVEIELIAAVD